MIKKWYDFILESESVSEDDTQTQNAEKDQSNDPIDIPEEVKDVVKEMIEKTIKENGGDFKSFVEDFKDSSKDIKINGLINDSDIFDFYLTWRNYLDPILNSINFFSKSPKKIGETGLYEYVVEGTKTAVIYIVKSL
jgi:hypothetical protein